MKEETKKAIMEELEQRADDFLFGLLFGTGVVLAFKLFI